MRTLLSVILVAHSLFACDAQVEKTAPQIPERLILSGKADGDDGLKDAGSLRSGEELVVDILYSAGERWLLFDLELGANETVAIAVHGASEWADPVAALYAGIGADGALELVAQNDDADDTTIDSYVEWVAPRDGLEVYLVVSDYFEEDATYRVVTTTTPAPFDPSALEAALEALIADLDIAIDEVEEEIARLEADLSAKISQIDGILHDIAVRKQEIEDNMKIKTVVGIAGFFFGLPLIGTVSLFAALRDDSRLQSLDRQLSQARAERSQIEALLADYRAHRAALDAKLAALRADEAALRIAAAPREPTPEEATVFADAPEVPGTALRLDALWALADNLRQQYEALVAARSRLHGIIAAVGTLLEEVIALEDEARNMADESQEELFDLIELLVAPNPEAAAAAWLEGAIKAKLSQVFGTLPTPQAITKKLAGDFADRVTQRLFEDPSQPLAQAFRDELVGAIVGGLF